MNDATTLENPSLSLSEVESFVISCLKDVLQSDEPIEAGCLISDLGVTSVELLDVIASLEKEYGISIIDISNNMSCARDIAGTVLSLKAVSV